MGGKNACIVADLRTGEHLTRVPDIVAVLSAAGWKTDIALKQYGGETIKLAEKAADDGYDLVIGYGGDGTLNAVFNGIMNAGRKSVVADIPGGTYNIWAGAIGITTDPVKAALAIVDSEPRKIDLGHIEVAGLTMSDEGESQQLLAKSAHKRPKQSGNIRQYFLLHVGIGIDAAMMSHIAKPIKYRFGPLAFDLAAMKELPAQRPFPLELQMMDEAGRVIEHWQGNVWQVIVSKVPLFGGATNIDPEARADDGLLSVSLMTAHGALKTIEQALSILTQHKLNKDTTQYFRGAHFSISVPASIAIHVDGSITRVEEFLHKDEQLALQQVPDVSKVLVNYHFDAEPGALSTAIPRGYSGSLFSRPARLENAQQKGRKRKIKWIIPQAEPEEGLRTGQEGVYKVTVVGVIPHPEKDNSYIIGGCYKKGDTDETIVVAVRTNRHTSLFNGEGKRMAPIAVLELQEGEEIMVEGEKNKRNVIRASSLRIAR